MSIVRSSVDELDAIFLPAGLEGLVTHEPDLDTLTRLPDASSTAILGEAAIIAGLVERKGRSPFVAYLDVIYGNFAGELKEIASYKDDDKEFVREVYRNSRQTGPNLEDYALPAALVAIEVADEEHSGGVHKAKIEESRLFFGWMLSNRDGLSVSKSPPQANPQPLQGVA
jgi:hypothetical protein